jgi:AcrR family transcriptional regulator
MAERLHEGLRADAQQNRDRILEVARAALAQSADASMNSIAKKAGVGAGTLYRHFPTREDLVLAVYRHDVEQLAASVPSLLAGQPPLQALRSWLERLGHDGMIKQGLAAALRSAPAQRQPGAPQEPVIAAIGQLLQACETDGSIGPGHEPDDVILLLGFLWRIDPGPEAGQRTSRLLDLVIAGLRAGAPGTCQQQARAQSAEARLPARRRLMTLLSFLRVRH